MTQPAMTQPAMPQPTMIQPTMPQPTMTQPAMPQPDAETAVADCLFGTIVGFMLPFFLVGAKGNRDVARTATLELIEAYNASNATELDLVGRIIGFSAAAMDNLRLSLTPNLPDTMVLRYRSNAVTLSRASDRARTMLEAAQTGQEQRQKLPRPSVAMPPPALIQLAAPEHPEKSPSGPLPGASPTPNGGIIPPVDIETMKHDARIMMHAFSKHGIKAGVAMPVIPNPAAISEAAAHAAVGLARRSSAA